MEPPSYEEARLQPPALSSVNVPPPPSYSASLSSPTTPPPSYQEAVGATPTVSSRVSQTVIVSQPQRTRTISVAHLRDVPGVVRCPHCHHVVTTQVTYLPGRAAYCLCILLTAMGTLIIPAHTVENSCTSTPDDTGATCWAGGATSSGEFRVVQGSSGEFRGVQGSSGEFRGVKDDRNKIPHLQAPKQRKQQQQQQQETNDPSASDRFNNNNNNNTTSSGTRKEEEKTAPQT
ncbi:uncharacterized protein V6R79_013597 [Siganus canaliculatus]